MIQATIKIDAENIESLDEAILKVVSEIGNIKTPGICISTDSGEYPGSKSEFWISIKVED